MKVLKVTLKMNVQGSIAYDNFISLYIDYLSTQTLDTGSETLTYHC